MKMGEAFDVVGDRKQMEWRAFGACTSESTWEIELRNHSLTVGPNGNVKADITAKAVVIQGKLDGAVNASDRVELRKSAVVNGDVTTQRIAIEEGAFLKGKVDIQKEVGKAATPASK